MSEPTTIPAPTLNEPSRWDSSADEARILIARLRLDPHADIAPGSDAFELLAYFSGYTRSGLERMDQHARWEILMDLDGRYLSRPPEWAHSAILLAGDDVETCTHRGPIVEAGNPHDPCGTFELSLARIDEKTADEITTGTVSVLVHSGDNYTTLTPAEAAALAAELDGCAREAVFEQEKAGGGNLRHDRGQTARNENDHE